MDRRTDGQAQSNMSFQLFQKLGHNKRKKMSDLFVSWAFQGLILITKAFKKAFHNQALLKPFEK